ncbi:MAG: AsmA family protein [Undibacterium sp.]|nr:AsmA family protein [Undibacterium sp.]
MTIERRTKLILTVAIIFLSLPVIAVTILLNVDWNRVKPGLNIRVSEAIGRPFSITGDLSLTWKKQSADLHQNKEGWRNMIPWPYLVAQDIRIGNPSDLNLNAPAHSDMASVKQLTFSLNPLALLTKKIEIPVLYLHVPVIDLMRNAQGQNNWTLNRPDKPSAWQLELQRVVLTKGSIHLSDALKHADVTADIETINNDPEYGVEWQLRGKLNGEPISGTGRAGAVLALQEQTLPYPLMGFLRQGQTVISVVGSLTRPSDLAAIDMRLAVSGLSMGRLYALTGIILPETPPFSTEGHLLGTLGPKGGNWSYGNFRGKVGSSDINGDVNFQLKKPRPLLSGIIISESLLFSDLAPIIGTDSNASKATRGAPAVQPSNKILPVENFKTDRWTSIDADIKFSANNIIRKEALPINKLTTNLRLQDGVLTLLPLNFDLAGGSLSSDIKLDGSGKTGKNAILAEMKVKARHLKLKQVFPTLQELNASLGEINGDVSLTATGNSVASLLGASNGEVKALINQGTVSKLLLEEIGLNIGSIVFTRIVGDKQVKLNCLAADFDVRNGLMQANSFIVDTDDAALDIKGNINLTQEQLDLSIKPKSKGVRVISLRAPLYVRGSFQHPSVSVDKGVMAMRAGGAIALAALTPFAALIPLISTGPREDSDCAKLLADALVKPVAPAPGKTKK